MDFRRSVIWPFLPMLLFVCLLIVACAPVVPEASDTPAPTPPEQPSPTPLTTPLATLQSSAITIKLVSLRPQPMVIAPGQTATLPIGNGEIDALVHYPTNPYPASGTYPFTVSVDPPIWQAIVGNPGPPNTLTLRLHGPATGDFTVTIRDVPDDPPVSFGLRIVPNPVTSPVG